MTVRLTALLLMAGMCAPVYADYGRLFFTPAQRATLEDARKKNLQIDTGEDTKVEAPQRRNVTVNGVVRSSDGKSTVWLNNRAITGRQGEGLNVNANRNDNRVRLSVPESGRSVDLKVGQSVEIVSGTIADNYSRRDLRSAVTTSPPTADPGPAPGNLPATARPAPAEKPAESAQAAKPPRADADARSGVRRNDGK